MRKAVGAPLKPPIIIFIIRIYLLNENLHICAFSIACIAVCVWVAERRCDGLAVFVKEENKRLGGPFEVDIFNNMTLEECQTMCVRAEKYV